MAALVELDRNFVLEAWAQHLRPDKRLFQQLRDVTIEFPFEDRGICMVKIGKTIVMTAVACELVEPSPFGGGKNGFLEFSVRDATPSYGGGSGAGSEGGVVVTMASSTRGSRQSGSMVDITRLLETTIKGAKVIDVEALCVVPGKFVWSLRVDVTILNQEGNVTDAAVWGSITALQHFRRPEVSVLPGNRVVVHQPHERDPIPLNLHHFPISITAAIVPPSVAASSSSGLLSMKVLAAGNEDNDNATAPTSSSLVYDFVIDPTVAELAASAGVIIVALNHELQLCDIHKQGAIAVPFALIQRVIAAAKSLIPQLASLMKETMAKDEAKRKAESKAAFTWAKTRTGVGKN